MKINNIEGLVLTLLFLSSSLVGATELKPYSSSSSANVKLKLKVKPANSGNISHPEVPITLSKVSDLDFGEVYPGEGPICLSPKDVGAAEYTVMGEKNTNFEVSLPVVVVLTTNGGNLPEERIVLDSFSSDAGTSKGGWLNATGTARLTVGACRAAILENQVLGEYEGSISVTVTYQ